MHLLVLAGCAGALAAQEWKDRPVLDTARSPGAVLRGVPVSAVRLEDGFWSRRRKTIVEVSLPTLLDLFEQKGILDNFRRLSGRKPAERRGPLYTDSDIYKWLEAVAFVLQGGNQAPLRTRAEAVIDDVVAAQDDNGYLNTFYSAANRSQRHTNLRHGHELYCLGHQLQAGIAWFRATGDRKLLDSGVRMVEYLLREFGPHRKPIFDGHPEIELALVELYRVTGDRRYLDFAGYLLNGDPRNLAAVPPREWIYLFTVKPFLERTRLEGHAVRSLYACSGATDYWLETRDPDYARVLGRLWEDMTRHKMYLTGGVGSRAQGEAFGEPYELPNQQAYTESCAAIATMFWNWRLAHASPEGKYLDSFERALYNGVNSGLSLEGSLYCYRNPLELVGNPDDTIRNPWYDTTCCPPNLQRILASLPGYFYSTSKEGLWVHLFDNNAMQWKLEDGTPVSLRQQTRYPWEGRVAMTVNGGGKAFTLFIRKPHWSGTTRLEVAGQKIAPEAKRGYFVIRRVWGPADPVVLDWGLTERLTVSNLRVRENLGKAAVERGPLVYCMEELDQPSGASLFDWFLDTAGGTRISFRSEWRADRLGGVTVVRHPAVRPRTPAASQPLYQTLESTQPEWVGGEITLVPYYTFHNRGITPMQVWIPYR